MGMNYIIGASGHGKVLWNILRDAGVPVAAFVDADHSIVSVYGVPVLHDESEVRPGDNLMIGVGNNLTRKRIADRISAKYISAVHPSVIKGYEVRIGEGTVLMPGVTINTGAELGRHVILNTQCSVDHDCRIDDFAHIAPGAMLCGGVEVGEGTLVGVGACIIPLIKVGKWVTIGAGTVITQDIPDYAVVVGNPGKIIKYID